MTTNASSSAAKRRQKLVKRACDPCKIRKIKCSEVSPCSGCVSAGIECTFNRTPATRGPRTLRAKTIHRIASERQDGGTEQLPKHHERDEAFGGGGGGDLNALLELLGIYATRLFPIWPIVDATDLSTALLTDPLNTKARHLADAVALATIAQLKLTSVVWKGNVDQIEHDALSETDTGDLVDSLRVSFFLHIYHENQMAGGIKSLLYLREAITKAQLLRFDREATYSSLDGSDQQLLRRLVWLLFVTERGVAMLHKLPVVLRPNTLFPWATDPSRDKVLPAFLKLVHLFYVFDQSGIFELLRNSDTDVSNMEALARGCLELLQRKLIDSDRGADGDGGSSDVQKADIFVTRQWMRAVLWRAAKRFGVVVDGIDPVGVAGEFLALVSRLPTTALESQGPTLEFKTYEIATAVVDAVTDRHSLIPMSQPREVLYGLYSILSSSRGGNKTLLALLNSKLAMASPDLRLLLRPSPAALRMPFLPEQFQWDSSMAPAFVGVTVQEETEEDLADLSWPPLDLGNMLRSPSPMTQMLLETHQHQEQYQQQHQQSSIVG